MSGYTEDPRLRGDTNIHQTEVRALVRLERFPFHFPTILLNMQILSLYLMSEVNILHRWGDGNRCPRTFLVLVNGEFLQLIFV